MQSYWQVVDRDIIDVKRYLLTVCEDVDEVHDLVNQSMDIYILKKKIAKNKELEILVFTRIKRLIDRAVSLQEMEYDLVMMNLLIEQHFYPLLIYKYKLLNHILELGGFSVETYCLLRHLIKLLVPSIIPLLISYLNEFSIYLIFSLYNFNACFILGDKFLF